MEDIQLTAGQCARCIFKMTGKLVCVAFPRGIPADILSDRFDHTAPYTGDGGINFVPLHAPRVPNRLPTVPTPR